MTGSRPLTELEIQNILQSFTGKYSLRNRTLFLLGLNTGARISELLSLDVGDVWRYKRPVEIIYLHLSSNSQKVITFQPPINTNKEAKISS